MKTTKLIESIAVLSAKFDVLTSEVACAAFIARVYSEAEEQGSVTALCTELEENPERAQELASEAFVAALEAQRTDAEASEAGEAAAARIAAAPEHHVATTAVKTTEQSTLENTLAGAIRQVAGNKMFLTADADGNVVEITKWQAATNDAIAMLRTIAATDTINADPETQLMKLLAIANATAKQLAVELDDSGYLSAYLIGRRVMHQVTYMALQSEKEALRMEQLKLRSNASTVARKFVAADDWATEFTTVEHTATPEELLREPEGNSPITRAAAMQEAAEAIYELLKRPMGTFGGYLAQREAELAEYFATVGQEYVQRSYLHSFTSVQVDDEYEEALSFAEARQLHQAKALAKIERKGNNVASIRAARDRALNHAA